MVYLCDVLAAGVFYQNLHFSVKSVVGFLCAEVVHPMIGLSLCRCCSGFTNCCLVVV